MSGGPLGDPPATARPEQPRRTGPVHLLWAVPVAFAVALLITGLAEFAACGISGCSGGGFGRSTDLWPIAAIMVLVAGVVVAAPLALVRWTSRRAVRVVTAAAVGLAWVLWAWPPLGAVL